MHVALALLTTGAPNREQEKKPIGFCGNVSVLGRRIGYLAIKYLAIRLGDLEIKLDSGRKRNQRR